MEIDAQGVGKVPLMDQVVIVDVIYTQTDWIMNFGGVTQN